jgi:ABC-type polysaccharide/polyol phosphate export permease
MAFLSERNKAFEDISSSWKMRNDWLALAWQSIRISYRRTSLGPYWISLQQAAFVAGISLLYSQLLQTSTSDMVPLAAFGIVFWGLITNFISTSSTLFVQQAQSIKSATLPLTFYIFSSISQQIIVFAHSAIVIVPFAFVFNVNPRLISVITIPISLFLVVVNGLSFALWLGPLSARFRDISISIPIVIQIAMFLSPVFWSSDLLSGRGWIIHYNPFAWMIETFRSPILGGAVKTDLWIRLAIFSVANFTVGITVFTKARDKISYWI